MNRLTEELLKIDTALRKSKRKEMDVGKIERRVAKQDEDVAVLLSHLGLRLPSRSKTVQNVVEKNS